MTQTRADRSADLTSGPMLQKIILFSIPLAASSILQLLFNAAQTLWWWAALPAAPRWPQSAPTVP